MPPVEGARAEWQPPTRRPAERPTEGPTERAMEPASDGRRLEAALDRISAAIVRRAERDAHAADASSEMGPVAEHETIDEIRRRLDAMIDRVRTLLGDAAF